MNEREKQEITRRVGRRLRAEKIEETDVRRGHEIAAEEMTKFFIEKQRNKIQWTKPTLGERVIAGFRVVIRGVGRLARG